MRSWHSTWRFSGWSPAAVTAVVLSLGAGPPVLPPTENAASPPPPGPKALTLQACRQLAVEQQPAVAAARASLAAAVARSNALDHLHVPTLFVPDLPIRRKQSALGVVIAEAALHQAEADAIYAVTYCCISYLYAGEQLKVAENASKDLQGLKEAAERAVKVGEPKNVRQLDVDKVAVYLRLARGRREEAVQGEQRALSALREAVGLGPDCPVQLVHDGMFQVNLTVDLDALVQAALAHRGELIQARNAAQVTDYEIAAQKASRKISSRTFASGSDIHANSVPAPLYDENYHPGGVGLEMPTTITGSRCNRIEQARAYNARAEAVLDKTRNLIVLEAEQVYYRWREAANKEAEFEPAAVQAKAVFKTIQDNFAKHLGRFTVDQWLSAGLLATDLRLNANRARYHRLLALAVMERVTGGAFCAGFEGAPFAPPSDSNAGPGTNGEALRNGPPIR